MKKLFTPLLLFLTVLLGGINASAEDEVIELTGDMFHQWDGYGADAKVINPSPGIDNNIGEGYEGGMFLGTAGVAGDIYADLTDYKGIEAEGTPGLTLRLLFNRPTQNEGITECNATFDNDGKLTFLFSNVKDGDNPASFIHLNAVKSWGNGTVKYMKLIPKPDPLELNADWFHQWDGYGADAKVINTSPGVDDNIGEGYEGGMFLGTAGVAGDIYADLTDYKGIVAEGTPELTLRLLFNRPTQNDGITECNATFDKDGNLTFLFSNVKDGDSPASFIHLNAVKSWGNGTVKYMKLIPKPDANTITGEWWHQWDGFGADAQIIENPTKGWVDNIGQDLNGGDFIIGNSACDGDCYADLTEYAGIEGVATPGTTVRFYFNRADVQGAGIDVRVNADDEGNYSCLFKEVKGGDGNPVSFVHLAFVKIISNGVSDPKVESMKVIAKPDPIVEAKENLTDQIKIANQYDSFAKTEASWNALQDAIAAAESAMVAENATVETLEAASANIAKAIEGLTLEEGYEYLTAEMFKEYASLTEPGEGTEVGCAYDLFQASDLPYGDTSVNYLKWADLKDYDKLKVTYISTVPPRFCMNRTDKDGQESNGGMLDMAPDNGNASTSNYLSTEDNVVTIDLKKMVAECGYARLHCIKKLGWGDGVIVTGMYLYNSTDELELPLENLVNEIAKAEQCDKFLKTDESWNALQTAIEEGKAELEDSKHTVESVEAATAKITEAIEGLKLQEGYSELTKDMFKKYNSVDNPGEGETTGCDYKLFEKTGNAYGDGTNVGYLNWADVTDYDKLIVKASGNPRFCLNRQADGGQQGDTKETSGMIDIYTDRDSWSAERYLDPDGDVYTVDLAKIIDDDGFARLHAIKYPWGQDGIVTNMYLYKDPANAAGFNLIFDIDDPAHVVIEINGEVINDLKAGANEKAVANRAKLSIYPAENFKLTSVKADGEEVKLNDGILTKTIVKNISFEIITEDADPLAQPKKELTAIIESAKFYDAFAKTEESFAALTNAIAAAEKALEADDATETSLTTAGENITKAKEGLTLEEGYSYLTPEMFKKYASVEEPGEGEETDCIYELFNTSRDLYGAKQDDNLKWADLSKYDQLILTTVGDGDLPRFCMNNEVSTKFEINPYDGTNEATEAYQTVDENRYIIDLKKIVKDHEFAHLHGIHVNGWGTGAFLNGMYLYKNPYVAVEVITLDKTEINNMIVGKTAKLTATVAPDNATEPNVTWSSDNTEVATVDEDGIVTAVAAGKATITATAGDKTATCEVTVKNALTGVEISQSEATMTNGETLTLTATLLPENAIETEITWSSDNEEVAKVENGKVTAVAIGKATITATAGGFTATCAIKCYPQLGDADWNGKITVNDAVEITNYIVGKTVVPNDWIENEWKEFYTAGANANGDEYGDITISDASATVSLALTQPTAASAESRIMAAINEDADKLVIGGLNTAVNGETSVAVTLDNSMEYVAIQADIFVPEGVNFEVKAGSRISDSHSFRYHRFDDTHVRVAIFNFGNVAFADNNEPLFEIVADSQLADAADITLVNIFASDSDAHEYALGSRYESTTGVAALGFDSNAPVKVYDLNGRYISDKVDGLEGGFYIIRQGNNAKKVRIR
ncbi:MAG: Ig-like domain-containing protein [Muribaculaceae bacterium]|nr:Ig-like domain-containing protein [Muribaculaceae bacterium]